MRFKYGIHNKYFNFHLNTLDSILVNLYFVHLNNYCYDIILHAILEFQFIHVKFDQNVVIEQLQCSNFSNVFVATFLQNHVVIDSNHRTTEQVRTICMLTK